MKRKTIKINNRDIPVLECRVAIVGSGAASLNAAVRLHNLEVEDIVIITEKMGAGTSANTGSDKQTYYRLNPVYDTEESVLSMARDLFQGGCMHGDIALVEAALSSRAFYHLVDLGVPFPHNAYGDYIGFKTDHDSRARGTSIGPKTSIKMVEQLYHQTKKLSIPIIDHTEIIKIITVEDQSGKQRAIGLVAVDKKNNANYGLTLIKADYIVYGTGGPAALYQDSVYPEAQIGSFGVALSAGAKLQNITESQFGIASKDFRWNLSGSYQQVIPRYFSTDQQGGDEREFLNDYFQNPDKLITAIFLKGYQWPFDIRKIKDFGSSSIDLLVYYETKELNRKVYLDFTQNPSYPNFSFSIETLPAVVKDYLQQSKAIAQKPIERLQQMNTPAYQIYLDNGIDLERSPLEIAVSNQHLNGGLVASIWWESSVSNFFPVGEAAGTHGIYRPGGSALNSGQVGSLRASEIIAYRNNQEKTFSFQEFKNRGQSVINQLYDQFHHHLNAPNQTMNPVEERQSIQQRVSRTLGIIRNIKNIEEAQTLNQTMIEEHQKIRIDKPELLLYFLKNEDLLLTEKVFLHASKILLEQIQKGRGSYLVGNIEDIFTLKENRPVSIKVDECDSKHNQQILEVWINTNQEIEHRFVQIKPIPKAETWFEKVWKDYRTGDIFH